MADMENIPLSSDSESGNEKSNRDRIRLAGEHSLGPAPPDLIPTSIGIRSGTATSPILAPSGGVTPLDSSLLMSTSSGATSVGGSGGGGGGFDCDEMTEADREEKQRLINQVLELQHTLEDLSSRVDVVKEENLKLRSENQILGQYIENLMAASAVFQSTSPKTRRKGGAASTTAGGAGTGGGRMGK